MSEINSSIPDDARVELLRFVRDNQPVNWQKAKAHINISRATYYKLVGKLKNTGDVYSINGSGTFLSREDYERWLKTDSVRAEKRMIASKGGVTRKNAATIRQKVMDFIPSISQPMTVGEIAAACGVSRKSAFRYVAQLANEGALQHNSATYSRLYMPAEKQFTPKENYADVRTKPKAFRQYNPKRNGVVQAYLNSPARQRIMMIYGRAV